MKNKKVIRRFKVVLCPLCQLDLLSNMYICTYRVAHKHQLIFGFRSANRLRLSIAKAGQSVEKQALSNVIDECLNSTVIYKVMWQNVN